MSPRKENDAAYQSLSDEQKFNAIKPRSIQQSADLELYNEILQNHANEIKATAHDAAERSRLLREISQTSERSVPSETTPQQQVTE